MADHDDRQDAEIAQLQATIDRLREDLRLARDVTPRRQQEAEQVQDRLTRAQQLETLGLLAGGIAHDFNNLLASILGNASLALSVLPAGSDAHRAVERVVASADTAASLTKQMLAYSGKGRFVVEPLDLSALVEESADLLGVTISKAARLQLRTAPDLPLVRADAAQLRQLVMNLITNASDALEDQPGTITITTRAVQADGDSLASAWLDRELPPGCYVELEVADTGCGMDHDTQQHMFDPFFSTKDHGHGLGMAAIQGIVRGHEGALRVVSEVGRGTAIQVLMRSVEDDCPCTTSTPPEPLVEERPPCVLVVDDEDGVRTFLQAALEMHGHTVLAADDGDVAVDVFARDPDAVDLVLLDMTMPRMSGVETFHALREIRPDIRILLTSGYNQADATSHFTADGRAGFIQKPYRLARLLDAIRALLPTEQDAAAAG